MLPIDDLDERLRRAAMADRSTAERVASAALSGADRAHRPAGLVVIAALALVCVVAIGAWWSWRPPTSRAIAGDDGIISLRAPDGTTWIFAGPSGDMLPPGTCVVIAAGGSQ